MARLRAQDVYLRKHMSPETGYTNLSMIADFPKVKNYRASAAELVEAGLAELRPISRPIFSTPRSFEAKVSGPPFGGISALTRTI